MHSDRLRGVQPKWTSISHTLTSMLHSTDMNATLRDRLIIAEQRFLVAVVAQDETALGEISLELSRLVYHFKAIESSGDLDDNTAHLLSRVSQVIRATAQCMLECEDALKDAQSALISCSTLPLPSDDLLAVSTSHPTFTAYPLLFSDTSSSGSLAILGQNKLLDACAYRWLTRNMHNPYPTSAHLQIIGDESLASVAQVEVWFQEARDLIGWTRLSDEFFTGSPDATITAAGRVYLEHDNTIPLCIVLAFSKVKAFMETLFSESLALPTQTSCVECSGQPQRGVPVGQDYSKKFQEEFIANYQRVFKSTTRYIATIFGTKRKLKRIPHHLPPSLAAKGVSFKIQLLTFRDL